MSNSLNLINSLYLSPPCTWIERKSEFCNEEDFLVDGALTGLASSADVDFGFGSDNMKKILKVVEAGGQQKEDGGSNNEGGGSEW